MKEDEQNRDLELFKQAFSETGPVPSGEVSRCKGNVPYPSIPGYEILELLGSGGMGAVYKARQIAMDRIVALKIMKRELAEDAEFVQRFTTEARNAGKVRHENIVSALDCGEAGGFTYMVMEFIQGRSLAAILEENGRLPERKALEWVRQVAFGLQAAWERRIIHRDIKPENILVTTDGVAKICDLGLSRTVGNDVRLTQTGVLLCTPSYASPEHARGERDLDIRTDIYSLGVTLYQLTTGVLPFEGESGSAVLVKHVTEKPKPPIARNPELSPRANRLILQMMEKTRSARPSSPAAVGQAIEAILAESAHPASPTAPRATPRTRRSLGEARGIGVPATVWIGGAVVALAVLVVLFLIPSLSTQESAPQSPNAKATARRSASSPPPTPIAPASSAPSRAPDSTAGGAGPNSLHLEHDREARRIHDQAKAFAAANPSDPFGQLDRFRRAALAADGTPIAEEAKRDFETAQARLSTRIKEEAGRLDEQTRTLLAKDDFKGAFSAIEAARASFAVPEWTPEIEKRAAALKEAARARFDPLRAAGIEAKQRRKDADLAKTRQQVLALEVDELLREFDEAVAVAVPLAAPPPSAGGSPLQLPPVLGRHAVPDYKLILGDGRFRNEKKASMYLAGHLQQAIGKVVIKGVEIREWLRTVAGQFARERRSISWVTPTGFRVVQDYRHKDRRVQTVCGTYKKREQDPRVKPDALKHQNSLVANLVHSLDASHMMLTVTELHRQGLRHFGMAHDSYAVHAADVDLMNRVLREQFIRVHEEFTLAGLHEQLKRQAPGLELPPPPATGSLDLGEVRKSEYLFS